MKNENKGQIRIIEAFLAVLIIFSSFAISANLTVTQNITHHDNLASIGSQALVKLDSDGSLSRYIDYGDWSAFRDALNLVLPAGIAFNLTVYNGQMQQVNTDVVSNGGFSSQDIAFVEYVCASQGSTFHCYVIYLYLAVAA
jgi:hypothetical protein